MLLNNRDARLLISEVMEHIVDWPIKTAEAFRNAVLSGGFAVNPLFKAKTEEIAEHFRGRIVEAVADGRMIDFGFLPNELMKEISQTTRDLYESNQLEHPYEEWLACARWEGGSCGYLFMTTSGFPGCVYCLELYGVDIPRLGGCILLYDAVGLETEGDSTTIHPTEFVVQQTDEELKARGANSLDPLVTMLRILADASVPIIDHPAPVRLNKARARAGKPPIPAHTEVKTGDYVSSYKSAKSSRVRVSKGGHHSSPIAHNRRHHLRRLASGKVVPVRETKVNWRDSEALHRLFYRLPKGETKA